LLWQEISRKSRLLAALRMTNGTGKAMQEIRVKRVKVNAKQKAADYADFTDLRKSAFLCENLRPILPF
jgi:hypothetical protein